MINFYRGLKVKYQESPSDFTDNLYFTTDTNEILINGKVYGKNADSSVTSEDVVVANGPLANAITYWPEDEDWNSGGNKIIPAGTSMQTLTEKLFLKETNGTVSWGSKYWNPSLEKPTVTLSSDGPVEVGSTVTCTVTPNSTVSNNKRYCTCTASEGHFTSIDGSWIQGNKTVEVTGDKSGTLVITYTWNDDTISNFANNSTTLKIKSGENKFVASQNGITAFVDALPETTVYASTNTKKVLSNVSAKLTDTKPSDEPLSESNYDTITGYYRYFIGECDAIAADKSNLTSDLVRSLISKKSGAMTTNQISYTVDHNPTKGFVVACPATNTLDFIKDDASVYEGGFDKKTMDVKDAGGTNVSYNVYYCNNTGANKATYKFFKFK